MASQYYMVNFAQAYGEDAYGACEYNDTTACQSSGGGNNGGGSGTSTGAGSGSGNNPGGQLSDTGLAIVAIVTLAAILMLVAIIVRVWRRSTKKLAAEPAYTATDNDRSRNR